MALAFMVDDITTVDEKFRDAYVKRGDKYVLDTEEDVLSMKESLGKANKEAAARRSAITAWEKLGKTPEEIAALLAEKDDSERKKLEEKGEWDKIRAQIEEKYTKEISERDAELQAARASERQAIIENRVVTQLTVLGATVEGLQVLPRMMGERINLVTENGQRHLKILMDDGKTPMAGSGADGTATVEDLAKDIKKKFPSLFGTSQKPGMGGEGGGNGGGGTKDKVPEFKREASTSDKVAAIRARINADRERKDRRRA